MKVLEYIIRKIFFWRNNLNANVSRCSSDDDEHVDRAIYVDKHEINQKLTERFGSNEIHQENLRHFISSDLVTIGSGGFSVVKKGYSTKHSSNVAVKIIRLDEQDNQSYIQNYLPVELKLWEELSESKPKYILNLLDITSVEPFMYVTTELVEHGDLYQCMLSSALSEFKSKSFFRQIIEAVAFCHSLGIAHRDIKPENLLLTQDENIKLADFSFVTKENPVHSQHCGTPGMIAPEQASRHSYNPFKSDIWQLGITLYMMLFRKSPYEKMRKADLLGEIAVLKSCKETYKTVPFPRNKMLSIECKDLVANMLAVDPTERFDIRQVQHSSWLET